MGLKAVSSSGGTSILTAAYQPKMQLVGQRCGVGAWGGSSSVWGPTYLFFTHHQRVLCPNGANAIQLVYPNFNWGPSGEFGNPAPWVYTATGVTYTGGTLYQVGDIDTFTVTASTGISPVRVQILAVSAGVPTAVQIINGGLYVTQLGSGVSPASTKHYGGTAGAGTGATATFTWTAAPYGMHIGIEKVWGTEADGTLTTVVPVPGAVTYPNYTLDILASSSGAISTATIEVNVPIGGAFGIRTTFCGNGFLARQAIASNWQATPVPANYEASFVQTTLTDYSISGAIGTTANAGGLFTPSLILGIPKKATPTVISLGDSKVFGQSTGNGTLAGFTNYDPQDADGNQGPFEKALSSTLNTSYWPWANFASPGISLQSLIGLTSAGMYGALDAVAKARPTAVRLAMYTNDFIAGVSTASMQANEEKVIDILKGLGEKYVYTETCDPMNNSIYYVSANPTIQAGGSGYAVSSTFNVTLAGGTLAGASATTVSVTTNGSGVVTTVNSYTNNGGYTQTVSLSPNTPSTPNTPTGGSGTGLQLNVLYSGFGNQSDISNDSYGATAKALVRNNALVAGTWATYDFFVDNRSIVENAVGGMTWKTNGTIGYPTGDGLHKSPPLIAFCAANESATVASKISL